MNAYMKILTACLLAVLMTPFMAQAGDGNWKKGRIYYRMVCTDCHNDHAGGAISPRPKPKPNGPLISMPIAMPRAKIKSAIMSVRTTVKA